MVARQWQVGGQSYEYEVAPTCGVCVSFRRAEVDAGLAAGRSPAELVRGWSYSAGPTADEVREHVGRGHVTVAEPPRSAAAGEDVTTVSGPGRGSPPAEGRDIAAFAETLLAAVAVRIEAGEVQPTVRDGVAVANLLARLDQGNDPAGYVDTFTMEKVMSAWMDSLRMVMTKDQMKEFGRHLNTNPLLKEMEREDRRRGRT